LPLILRRWNSFPCLPFLDLLLVSPSKDKLCFKLMVV
jgi:hypothetical protein